MKIEQLWNALGGRLSRPILYTYDALLFDVHPIERGEIIRIVKDVMETGGFPVRLYEGKNYNQLEVIS
jgi:hypothetical protein